jgi:precorrin-6B methylase 1
LDWLDARILTAHDRLPELSTAELVRWDKIAILAGHRRAQAWIADLAHDLALSHRLVVCEDLSLAEESIRSLDAAAFRRLTLSGRTIVLLVKGGGGEFSYP